MKKRIEEIDAIINRLFEQNVAGTLSDERFKTMLGTFENEQATLKAKAEQFSGLVDSIKKGGNDSGRKFLQLVRRYSQVTELTPEIATAFINKVLVY